MSRNCALCTKNNYFNYTQSIHQTCKLLSPNLPGEITIRLSKDRTGFSWKLMMKIQGKYNHIVESIFIACCSKRLLRQKEAICVIFFCGHCIMHSVAIDLLDATKKHFLTSVIDDFSVLFIAVFFVQSSTFCQSRMIPIPETLVNIC